MHVCYHDNCHDNCGPDNIVDLAIIIRTIMLILGKQLIFWTMFYYLFNRCPKTFKESMYQLKFLENRSACAPLRLPQLGSCQ